ncbi:MULTISPECIES: DUF2971 domain-containing protein [Aeromonas]|uniref:DUF2971 domain-containing protein n=1 Tax=Aeromonas TaxID=642 RepID=UPI00164FA98A|nr:MULTISPECIES: DUF2971 domain-containing protein [Aeromonas]MDI3431496.1 DUF2971 domain-containing protein [Aeromonas sp. V90_14]
MNLLFKYSPIIKTFFNKPTIKLSVPTFLNDPFENMPSEDIKDISNEITRSVYGYRDLPKIVFDSMYSDVVTELLNKVGIVSLTETPRNLLMWAHYANNHNGMVVGFEPEIFSHLKITARDRNVTLPVIDKPIKIKYDNTRFDEDNLDRGVLQPHERRRDLIVNVLTRKSDDWIYEKEHRAILPLRYADDVRLNIKDGYEIEDEILKLVDDRMISLGPEVKTHKGENYREISYEANHPKFDLISKLSLNRNISFLVSIPPEKVKCIYLGCRVKDDEYHHILDLINSKDSNLNHVAVFRYKINPTHFSLDRY